MWNPFTINLSQKNYFLFSKIIYYWVYKLLINTRLPLKSSILQINSNKYLLIDCRLLRRTAKYPEREIESNAKPKTQCLQSGRNRYLFVWYWFSEDRRQRRDSMHTRRRFVRSSLAAHWSQVWRYVTSYLVTNIFLIKQDNYYLSSYYPNMVQNIKQ